MTRSQNRSSLLLVLLTGAYGLSFLDRLMMAVVAQPVQAEFGLSDKELSLLTGAAFVLVYGSFGIMCGWLLDRFNKNIIVALGVGIWSVFTAACGVSQNFTHLAIARAGVGTGESVIVPAAMALISENYSLPKRPLAMGVFYAGGMVGVFLAWVLGGWIATHYGWRNAFYMAGPPGIVLAVLIAWVKVDTPRETPAHSTKGSHTSTFRDLFRNAPFVWLISGSSMVTFVSIGLVNMLGIFFIRSHGMSTSEVGFVFGPVMAAGMACGLIGGGWLGNHLAHRGVEKLIRFSAWSAFALFPIYMALLLAPSKELALAAMFVGAMVSTLYSPCYSAAYQTVSAPHTRATAAGVQGFLNALIGGALTPFLVGALSDYWRPRFGRHSLRYAMMVGLLTCLIAGLMFMRARRQLTRDARNHTNPVALS